MTDEIQALMASPPETRPVTREEVIESNMTLWRTLAGSRFPFDEEGTHAREEAAVDRGHNPKNSHVLAAMAAPSRLDALRKLNVLTQVIHGDEEPILNYCHGVACAKVIPGAKL